MDEDELRAEFERQETEGWIGGPVMDRNTDGRYLIHSRQEAWEYFRKGALWAANKKVQQ